jgi:hypothetical protein
MNTRIERLYLFTVSEQRNVGHDVSFEGVDDVINELPVAFVANGKRELSRLNDVAKRPNRLVLFNAQMTETLKNVHDCKRS